VLRGTLELLKLPHVLFLVAQDTIDWVTYEYRPPVAEVHDALRGVDARSSDIVIRVYVLHQLIDILIDTNSYLEAVLLIFYAFVIARDGRKDRQGNA